jgi:hypothetical protein
MEIWKDIEGYSGDYQISNYGRVKSFKNGSSKILKCKTNNKGYKWVALCLNGVQSNLLVHRLVAMHFLDNDKNYKIINHIDENPANNNVSNLEWCTYSENIKKSTKFRKYYEINYPKNNKDICTTKKSKNNDTSNGVKQLLNGQVVRIFKNSLEVKKCLGFDQSFILSVCRNKRKTAYGYQWQFA